MKKAGVITLIVAAILTAALMSRNILTPSRNTNDLHKATDAASGKTQQVQKKAEQNKLDFSNKTDEKPAIIDVNQEQEKQESLANDESATTIPESELSKWIDFIKKVSKIQVSNVLIKQTDDLISVEISVREKAADKTIYYDLVNHIQGLHNAYPDMPVNIEVFCLDSVEAGFAKYDKSSDLVTIDVGKKEFEGKIETLPKT